LRHLWVPLLLLSLGLANNCTAETFRSPRHIPIPSNPLQVGTADFNGDGRPDFYYVDPSGLNVTLANSDGNYRKATAHSTRSRHPCPLVATTTAPFHLSRTSMAMERLTPNCRRCRCRLTTNSTDAAARHYG
jgi:FG-GAP-like repeat